MPTQPNQNNDPFGNNNTLEQSRPIFLSGKVLMANGEVPPDSVVVEMVCFGSVRPQGYTDSKGRFSFQLGQNNAMIPDASIDSFGTSMPSRSNSPFGNPTTGGINPRDLNGCELRGNLAGFRSDVVPLAGRQFMDRPEVGTIVLHPLSNVQGFTFSATTAAASKDARKAYEKGAQNAKKKKWADAQKELEKAVQLHPKYAIAWFELGEVYRNQKNMDGARNAYAQALAADAKFVKPYLPMAEMAVSQQNWEVVADVTNKLTRLDPYQGRAFFYNAVANLNLRKLDDAETSAAEALKLDSDQKVPKLNHVMGVILAQKGDLVNAARYIKLYVTRAPNAADVDMARNQLAEIEKLVAGQTAAPTPAVP
jgi:tetratricopeptide (TPR) repeat protein